MTHLRIFTAVNLSVPSIRKVGELQQQLRQSRAPDLHIRWVPPPNMHVTLKFYGNLGIDQLEAVKDAARRAAAMVKPFGLSARGLGVFPGVEKPRVLWVGLGEGAETLAELFRRLEDASEHLGFARDTRVFRPHLTLGRVQRGSDGVAEWIAAHGEVDCLTSSVDELVVYESRLQRAGAEYLAHARIALGAPI
ncbi:MAG: RNA 2',3'-cyclic phosphodiesterase [Polyangia bacterium]|jgi:2'-5' RNA ligase|nr:RNA 2',3'-cyclic phosphodiesterase [Polyangia bacterium]